jgi:hypothetical protein
MMGVKLNDSETKQSLRVCFDVACSAVATVMCERRKMVAATAAKMVGALVVASCSSDVIIKKLMLAGPMVGGQESFLNKKDLIGGSLAELVYKGCV